MEKTFASQLKAEIWAEIYGYAIAELHDLEDDRGVFAVMIKEV